VRAIGRVGHTWLNSHKGRACRNRCVSNQMTMNCLAKPTQQTGEPEAPARASVPERFRRLKRNEVVWSGDFVADERLGFELWEAPDVFRAGSFARPITRRKRPKDSDRSQPENQNKKSLRTLKPNCGWSKGVRAILGKSQSVLRRSRYHQQSVQLHRDARKEGGRAFRLVSRSTGTCLADVNGDEVEAYLLEAGVLHLTAAVADAPANWACDAHHHE
jgi:hypothetical protein